MFGGVDCAKHIRLKTQASSFSVQRSIAIGVVIMSYSNKTTEEQVNVLIRQSCALLRDSQLVDASFMFGKLPEPIS
jgi:hypothetical protein